MNFERKGIDSLEMTLNEVLSPGTYRFIFETLDDNEVAKDLTTEEFFIISTGPTGDCIKNIKSNSR